MGGPTAPLLPTRRRLWIVTGKGGTGKTTLTATLALLATRAGSRVLVVSANGDDALAGLLGLPPARTTEGQIHAVAPRLSALFMEPEASLAEYIDLQLHVGGLGKRLLSSRAFHGFLEAAPGWRDLVTLGNLWHLEQEQQGARPRFDLIVVDAPATGHAFSLLSVPEVVLEAVRMGPLRRRAEDIRALLTDRTRTECVLVTQAEELPVRETLELASSLRGLGIALGPVLLNRWIQPLALDLELAREALDGVPGRGAPWLANPRALREVLDFRARRQAQHLRWLEELRKGFAEPLSESSSPSESTAVWHVPDLTSPLEGWEGVCRLADALAPSAAELRP